MISYLYKSRRHNKLWKDIKQDATVYATDLDAMFEGNFFVGLISSFGDDALISDVITHIRNALRASFGPFSWIYGGRTYNGILAVASRKVASNYSKITHDTHQIALRYIANYVWWLYESIEEIFEALISGGSVSRLELVGPRTLDYIKDLGLEETPKRFGTPNDYLAEPLIRKSSLFNLCGPPMTTATYKNADIEKVYSILNFPGVYYARCGKTMIARPIVKDSITTSVDATIHIATKSDGKYVASDLTLGYYYDYFLASCVRRMGNITFDIDNLDRDFAALAAGDVDNIPNYLKLLQADHPSYIHGLIGLIY